MTINNRLLKLREQSEKGLFLIKTNQFSEAQKLMNSIDITDIPGKRLLGHLNGKLKLVNNDFQSAINIFKNTQDNYGHHIALDADITSTLYLDGQFGLWRLAVINLNKQYCEFKNQIDLKLKIRIQILLAKFLEETGDIVGAVDLLNEIIDKNKEPQIIQKALTHLLRLVVQFNIQSKLVDTYYNLINQAMPAIENSEIADEIFHSLALAEAELFSIELTLNKISNYNFSNIYYKNLILYDLVEIELRKNNLKLSQSLTNNIINLKPYSIYEKYLHDLVLNKKDCHDWYTWSSLMPFAQYLRLMSIIINSIHFKDKNLAISQIRILLKSLSKSNQSIWIDLFYGSLDLESEFTLSFSKDGILKINNQRIDFGGKRLVIQLINYLIDCNTSSEISTLCQKIWSSEFNESYFHRIRQLIARANLDINKYFSVNLVILSEGKVYLNPKFKITAHD